MNDNFDLQKYLKESKALTNQNPFLAEAYTEFQRADQREKGVMAQDTAEEDIYGAGVEAGKHDAMRKKIREYILAELNVDSSLDTEEDLEEAKKKKKKEDVEDVEVDVEDTTDINIDDLDMGDDEMAPETDTPEIDIPDMGANLDGKEKDIMSHLMKALEIAKNEGNEKVITQISNTLKFFISEYIAQ